MSLSATRNELAETITVHIPFRIVKCGGRKEIRLPDGAALTRKPDNTLVKALARAFRWKRMLESGEFATITELAEREGLTLSFVTRVLRLTLLAPSVVEAILDGRQGPDMTLARALEPSSGIWRDKDWPSLSPPYSDDVPMPWQIPYVPESISRMTACAMSTVGAASKR